MDYANHHNLVMVSVQIIGALITHVGSGVNLEVGSALETMNLLVAKHPLELIRFSSYINGIKATYCCT